MYELIEVRGPGHVTVLAAYEQHEEAVQAMIAASRQCRDTSTIYRIRPANDRPPDPECCPWDFGA